MSTLIAQADFCGKVPSIQGLQHEQQYSMRLCQYPARQLN
jgi:hypothetical protein